MCVCLACNLFCITLSSLCVLCKSRYIQVLLIKENPSLCLTNWMLYRVAQVVYFESSIVIYLSYVPIEGYCQFIIHHEL